MSFDKKIVFLFFFFSFFALQAQIISTVAGNGVYGYSGEGGLATSAQLNSPGGIVKDASGNIFIADGSNHRIRKIDVAGNISTIAGNGVAGFSGDGGPAVNAKLNLPSCVVLDASGNLYITDQNNSRIRKVTAGGIITTIAGTGSFSFGGDGGLATSAQLNAPTGLAIDNSNNIYIADATNQRIRKINSAGIITTVAGNGSAGYSGDGGTAITANLNYPSSVAVDAYSNLCIADYANSRIRMVNTSGIISTIAGMGAPGFSGDGGLATNAQVNYPKSVFIDATGNIFIADKYNHRIRKIDLSNIITTVAGTGTAGYSGDLGPAVSAKVNYPTYALMDNSGNLLIADNANQRIRKVDASGFISTVAGTGTAGFMAEGGPATSAALQYPTAAATDKKGNFYIADYENHLIRKVNSIGKITTFAGNTVAGFSGDGGPAVNAKLNYPLSLVLDSIGNIYFSDSQNHRIRKIDTSGIITTIAGNGIFGYSGNGGLAINASLGGINDLAFDRFGNLYLCDNNGNINSHIRKVAANGIISNFAGNDTLGYNGDGGLAINSDLAALNGIGIDSTGNVFICDNHRIRKINTNGIINTIAGAGLSYGYVGDGGPAINALFNAPDGISFDTKSNLYITDGGNHVIRMIDTAGIINTIIGKKALGSGYSGDGGPADKASLGPCGSVAFDTSGNIYIADYYNNRIRMVTYNNKVWPGDANEDRLVDNKDLLILGMKYGLHGPPRSAVSNSWQGYLCSDWNDTVQNGLNVKFADCNGDSTINMDDTLALHLNYSQSHAYRLIGHPVIQTSNPDIYVQFDKPQYISGDTVRASVFIGASSIPQSNFYGSAFSVNYDESLVQPGTENFWFNSSWVGNINQTKIKFGKIMASVGRLDAGLVRITHSDTSGYGKVATFQFILKNTAPSGELYLTITNAIKVDKYGTVSSLNVGTDSVGVVNNTTGYAVHSGITSIYPNPATNILCVTSIEELGDISIHNSFGELVLQARAKTNSEKIDIGRFSKGVYIVQFKNEHYKFVKE